MTPEAQRIAIAEACGWEWRPNPKVIHPNKLRFWVAPWMRDIEGAGCPDVEPPDYLNDLNAIVSPVRMLSPTQRVLFVTTLQDVYSNGSTPLATPEDALIFASPAHYSESYLRTIGKWQD